MKTVFFSLFFIFSLCLNFNLTAEDNPPVAVNDSYSIQKNLILVINAPGVLANDYDLNGKSLTCIKLTNPGNGSLIFNADGSFSYTPIKDFVGNDFFTYKVSNGTLESKTSTVSILVTPPPNTPPISVDDIYSMEQNVSIVVPAPGILANDTDEEGKTITAEVVTKPLYGALNLAKDGSFSYTPKTNFTGKDSFTYKASDGELKSETSTVTIQVNPPDLVPEAVNDLYRVRTGKILTIKLPGVLENDKVMAGNTLTALVDTDPVHGSLNLSADGSFVYTPQHDFSGKDYFKYKATDGKITSSPGFVIIDILPALPNKVVTKEDSYLLLKNESLTVCSPGIIQNDSIPQNWAEKDITVKLKTPPAHGTAHIQPDGSLLYVPEKNFTGKDYLYYKVELNAGSSFIKSQETKVTLNVISDKSKLPPFPVADSYKTEMNTLLKIAPEAGLLLNDTIPSALNVTVELGETTENGTLNLNHDGSFEYSPTNGILDDDKFTYYLKYNNFETTPVTVKIKILPPGSFNSIPIAVDDFFSVPPNTQLDIPPPGLIANDSDKDNDPLYTTVTKEPLYGELTLNSNGSFTYTPKNNFSGKDSFTYSISDTKNSSENDAKVTILVSKEAAANNPPVAVDDYYDINEDISLNMGYSGPLSNDTDKDGNTLTLFVTSHPAHGTFKFDKKLSSFIYTPDWGFTGSDSFTYTARDEFSQSNVATVNIAIHEAGTNLAPVANGDIFATSENQTLHIPAPGVMKNDFDPNRYTKITATKLTDTTHGTLTFNNNGSFVYKPNDGFSGTDSFLYSISDGALSSTKTEIKILVQDNIISAGSLISVKASELNELDGVFLSKPKFSAVIFPNKTTGLKALPIAVNAPEAQAVWTKRFRLYDKKAIKAEGYPQWIKNNIQSPAQCDIKVKYMNINDQISFDSAGTYLLVPPIFDYFTVNGQKTSSVATDSEITVHGRFFGSKKPKVFIIPVTSGKTKKLKVVTPLFFPDFKSKPGKSCMDIHTGKSSLTLYVSRKIIPGRYYFVLDNKIGIAVDPINHELPILDIK